MVTKTSSAMIPAFIAGDNRRMLQSMSEHKRAFVLNIIKLRDFKADSSIITNLIDQVSDVYEILRLKGRLK